MSVTGYEEEYTLLVIEYQRDPQLRTENHCRSSVHWLCWIYIAHPILEHNYKHEHYIDRIEILNLHKGVEDD